MNMRRKEKYKLNKVIFIFKNTEIENSIFTKAISELKESDVLVEEYMGVTLKEADGECGFSITKQHIEETALYVTDKSDVATYLLTKGGAVLGYLHEGGDSSFTGIRYVVEEAFSELDKEINDGSGDSRGEDGDGMPVSYLDRVYRRYKNIPWDILETERCLIRETMEDDVEAFFDIYSDPEITKYTEALYPAIEEEKAYVREYIEKIYHYFEFGVWTVILKETNEIIGRAGFSVREGYDLPELGFVIGTKWQHKQIAYEICKAILKYGEEELGFVNVQALVRPENEPSVALCKRLGFVKVKSVMEQEKEHDLFIR